MSWKLRFEILKALVSNPKQLLVKPSLNWFFLRYLRKFKIQKVGEHLILHSHLPPLNHPAYARFIDLHLLRKISGPSHAQIGVTNACPQRCVYCYNRKCAPAFLRRANALSAPIIADYRPQLRTNIS